MPSKTSVSAPNLKRGMAVLEYLATHQRSATIAELTERLGYPSASVYRIVRVLHELGYLSRDATSKRYTLTNKLLRFGQPQNGQRGLIEAALPALRGLLKQTGETSQICCLVDVDTVVLEQLISTHPFKYSTDLGARVPCYSCAPGKAMLAFLPEEQREDLISRQKFKRFTDTTITSRAAFRKALDEIRGRGFAVDRGEGLEGIHCVAAPIIDRQQAVAGALTIAGPASRVPESDFTSIGSIVTAAAAAASKSFRG